MCSAMIASKSSIKAGEKWRYSRIGTMAEFRPLELFLGQGN
jgi:hypothetical protein